MAKAYGLYVGIATALALCKYPMADQVTHSPANGTTSACPDHRGGDNCTDTDPWDGHFSHCPESYKGYCVHGVCRYLEEHQTPACRCDSGFIGARCEIVDLGFLLPETKRAIIIGVTAVLVALIVAIVLICFSVHSKRRFCWRRRQRRRREAPNNGTEKLSMMDTGASHTSPPVECKQATHSSAV